MSDVVTDLQKSREVFLAIQKEAEDVKQRASRLEGELKALIDQMKQHLGVDSVEALQAKKLEWEKELVNIHDKLNVYLDNLLQSYAWETVPRPDFRKPIE